MRFSIITVTFNSEKHLKQTLDSVNAQTFTDYEHILWDGGSTDGTLSIAAQYPRLKVYCGKDSGISDAMNKGAQFAQGDFIMHLHSDDFLVHNKVLEQADLILKQHPQLKWLYGRTQNVDSLGNLLRINAYVPFSHKKLKKYNIISHPAVFIDRALFLSLKGFSTHFRYCMDYDLWLRLAQITLPLAVPAIFSAFREHDHSLSSSSPIPVADEAYRVRNQYIKYFWQRWKSYRTWQKRRRSSNV